MRFWKHLRAAYLVFLALFVGVAVIAVYPIYQYLRNPVTIPTVPASAVPPESDAPRKIDPRSLLGVSPEMIPKFEEMVQRVAPKSAQAQVGLGILYQYKGMTDKAIERYQQAIELDPNLPDAHYRLGTAYHAQNRLSDAEESYRRAMSVKSDYLYAYFSLAALCQHSGRTDEATSLYKKILEIKPRDYQAHNNLAIVYEDKGMAQEALKEYTIAAQLNPNDPVVRENLKRARTELVDADGARAAQAAYHEVADLESLVSHIYLKNRQKLSGQITQKDDRGMWFKIDDGTSVYVFNEEIDRVVGP